MARAGVIVYLAGLVFAEALRVPRRVSRLRSRIPRRREAGLACVRETIVMLSVVLGIWVLPLVFGFTGWLRPFDYACPAWACWLGAAVFGASLVLRWKAHRDLGRHWSPTLDVAQDQVLVTDGIYDRIRHPIYVSLILWAAAQPLLLQNAVAGWGGVVAAALMWLVRVPKEEGMMLEAFGDAYREYMARTGRIIPRWQA